MYNNISDTNEWIEINVFLGVAIHDMNSSFHFSEKSST